MFPHLEITDECYFPVFCYLKTLRILLLEKVSSLRRQCRTLRLFYPESIAFGRRFLTLSIVKWVLDKRLWAPLTHCCPWWTRTTTSRTKICCPAIRRKGTNFPICQRTTSLYLDANIVPKNTKRFYLARVERFELPTTVLETGMIPFHHTHIKRHL